MEIFEIKNLSFTYPNRTGKALDNICLSVAKGEFVTLCGKSGCGKTTLLRLLKPVLAPGGSVSGEIYFNRLPLHELSAIQQAAQIGFVMQSCDSQIVTDKVWHELAFGLEGLGLSTPEIRARVAEAAAFFGIEGWFHKKTAKLSGGQKQLLSLASVMTMQPSVLILDEPTAQLDPIAAQEFLNILKRINLELGTTVILSEHRLEDVFPLTDRAVVLDNGKIVADAEPKKIGKILNTLNHDMCCALPTPMRAYTSVDGGGDCPVTVRDGRLWLDRYAEKSLINNGIIPKANGNNTATEYAVELNELWFRYEKNSPDVLKGLKLKIKKGELLAMVGGNGAGKSTALSIISGINKPYRGNVLLNGRPLSQIPQLYSGVLGVLPQNPQSLFVKNTVYDDLCEVLADKKLTDSDKELRVRSTAALCRIDGLLQSHPYDLSGGEQQRAALCKILLLSPEILLLDEPTKGLDACFKQALADIIDNLKARGTTIVMVSHDIEFCAEFADRCALMFDGSIASVGKPREFFSGKNFYTTAANRMARALIPDAVLCEDIILACGGKPNPKAAKAAPCPAPSESSRPESSKPAKNARPLWKTALGVCFALLFVFTLRLQAYTLTEIKSIVLQILTISELAACLLCFIPKRKFIVSPMVRSSVSRPRLTKQALFSALFIFLAIPLTIFIGTYFLNGRRYYFISLLIIIETMLPFCAAFESRKPQARELVIISVLCAISVAGRAAFFMLPQFKPVAALVIIAGVAFGGETGFLVGAVSALVSNFFFGQGPWTPWQMFSFGVIGFISGILFKKGLLKASRLSLSSFGFFATLIIYGGIMNPASVLMYQANPTKAMLFLSYIKGLPYDAIHAASTAFFLWFLSEPILEKLERTKLKYGLTDTEPKNYKDTP